MIERENEREMDGVIMTGQMDKEYLILSRIDGEEETSQRELARSTGLSLGTVNLLLKKMVREGLVKMESIPANRVVYMLTPKGMMEKAAKTVKYVKHHYGAIRETQSRIREALEGLLAEEQELSLLVSDDELGDLVRQVVREMECPRLSLIDTFESGKDGIPVVICSGELEGKEDSGYIQSGERKLIYLLDEL